MNQSVINDSRVEGPRLSYANNFNIVREMSGKDITQQDKDIEIERLKTTCFNLNNKAAIAEDLRQENEMLKKRLAENERARNALESENNSLRSDLSQALEAKTAMSKDLD